MKTTIILEVDRMMHPVGRSADGLVLCTFYIALLSIFMRYYFQLQIKIWFRAIRHFGLSPYIALPLLLAAFIAISLTLWKRTDMAVYLYAFIAVSILSMMTNPNKLVFLRSTYDLSTFYKIRLIENMVGIGPFVIFLFYKNLWLESLAFFLVALIATLLRGRKSGNHTIPSPFHHYLHEYTVGYRKWIWVYLLSYFLLYQSVTVDNFNLGMAAIALHFLIGMSFYQEPEGKYFVWIHAMSPKEFLWQKAKGAYLYSTLSAVPVALLLIAFNTNSILIIIGFLLFMGLYPVMMSQAKYSSYPREMNIGHAFLLSGSFIFPPSIFLLIYYFNQKSKNQLRNILA